MVTVGAKLKLQTSLQIKGSLRYDCDKKNLRAVTARKRIIKETLKLLK